MNGDPGSIRTFMGSLRRRPIEEYARQSVENPGFMGRINDSAIMRLAARILLCFC